MVWAHLTRWYTISLYFIRSSHAGDFWHERGALPVAPLNSVLEELQQIKSPTLMLVGNHDQVQLCYCPSCHRQDSGDSGFNTSNTMLGPDITRMAWIQKSHRCLCIMIDWLELYHNMYLCDKVRSKYITFWQRHSSFLLVEELCLW